MDDHDFFILDEDAQLKINDLVECLGLAIEKIVLSNRMIKANGCDHPAIRGFERMAEEAVVAVLPDRDLADIF